LGAREFVCADCKIDVCSYGGPPDETRCMGCNIIRSMDLSPAEEAELRHLFGCEIEKANDNALRPTDARSGRSDPP
jgi:hypothetical protein